MHSDMKRGNPALMSVQREAPPAVHTRPSSTGTATICISRSHSCWILEHALARRSEQERKRIERTNPNPKMPLVRYVGGTWRVGGILALSRAFGDAYLKGSLQFEGVRAGGDGYSSGFGVVAEPDTSLTALTRALHPATAHPSRCFVSKTCMCLAKPMRHAHGVGSPKSCLATSTEDMRG